MLTRSRLVGISVGTPLNDDAERADGRFAPGAEGRRSLLFIQPPSRLGL